MDNGIAGIDHVIVGVRDLERARMGWTRLGFTLSPRGRHLGQGTANYCVMFGSDYLELLGFVERDEYGHRLEAFLAQREGPMSVAFAPAISVVQTHAALTDLMFHPAAPRALGRQLELPEGTVVPRFSLVTLPPEETPALDCFICGHLTPELVRRPEWLAHPNGTIGIKAIHVLVADPASLAPAYRRLFGNDRVTGDGAATTVRVGRHRLVFTASGDFLAQHPGIELAPDFPLPGIAALELAIADRNQTADYLAQWQLFFDELSDGRLAVPAKEANGVVILLSQG